MRMLIWHVDSFKCTITEKGRGGIVEDPGDGETYVEEALIVYTCVERKDEKNPEIIAGKAADEIASHARALKVGNIVVHPFAHLFAKLGAPAKAIEIMDSVNANLKEQGFDSVRTPFGWFNRLDIKAKGHPLSRIARKINAG